ncbi:MAG: hemolysin III family protein [Candidatus Falkowbacteria bacterium]
MIRDKTNEIVSGATHGIGFLLSVAGLVVLIYGAVIYAGVWHIVSFSIFSVALVLTYGASTFYHIFSPEKRAKMFLRKLDHAIIYILIASTYTPVLLVSLRGGWGWSLFGIIWGLAILGIIWKLADWYLPAWLNGAIYLFLGWLIVIAVTPLMHVFSWSALLWLVAGGLSYSIGVIFFSLETIVKPRRYFGMHEIFHLFVMVGSLCHWILMFKYVMYI